MSTALALHPYTWPLLVVLAILILVESISIHEVRLGRLTITAGWMWQGFSRLLGIGYTHIEGLPASPEDPDVPQEMRGHHSLDIGCLLFTFHFTWFDREPPAA